MRTRWQIALFLLAFAAAGHAASPPPPVADVTRDGDVRIALAASLLQRPDVRKHLMSGLTANFTVAIAGSGREARIDIRYEPWDEVFFAGATSFDGRSERATLRSAGELEKWWTSPRLVVAKGITPGQRVRVVVEVIPFSASEEADAKKWIARSIGNTAARSSASTASTPETPSLFSAVVGSSIRRKPVLRYAWDVILRQAPR